MGEEAKQEVVTEETKIEKTEEKKEEKLTEKDEKKEEAKPPSPLVLSMDLHCLGCVKKIERIILKMKGVEGVVMDLAQNQVSIKGIVEPQAMCDKIKKKTKRSVKILSPLPEVEGQPIPQVVISQVGGLKTVELNVNMHCEACAAQLKRIILKMKGVTAVETELSSGKVTVIGTMEANKLVDYVYRRTRKQAKVVPQPEPEKPKEEEEKPAPKEEKPATEEPKPAEEKKEEAPPPPPPAENLPEPEGGGKKEDEGEAEAQVVAIINSEEQLRIQRMMYYSNYQPLYFMESVPPPQLFSDENPNACCIT